MKIRVTEMTVPGTSLNGTNPLPRFRRQTGFQLFETNDDFPEFAKKDLGACTRTLPYRMQDRYGRERDPQKLKAVVLENEYLRATVTPGYGGKLWSLYDKENGREILMSNPVLQPGNLAIRNAGFPAASNGTSVRSDTLISPATTCGRRSLTTVKATNSSAFMNLNAPRSAFSRWIFICRRAAVSFSHT